MLQCENGLQLEKLTDYSPQFLVWISCSQQSLSIGRTWGEMRPPLPLVIHSPAICPFPGNSAFKILLPILLPLKCEVWPEIRNNTVSTNITTLTTYKWLFPSKTMPDLVKQLRLFLLGQLDTLKVDFPQYIFIQLVLLALWINRAGDNIHHGVKHTEWVIKSTRSEKQDLPRISCQGVGCRF